MYGLYEQFKVAGLLRLFPDEVKLAYEAKTY